MLAVREEKKVKKVEDAPKVERKNKVTLPPYVPSYSTGYVPRESQPEIAVNALSNGAYYLVRADSQEVVRFDCLKRRLDLAQMQSSLGGWCRTKEYVRVDTGFKEISTRCYVVTLQTKGNDTIFNDIASDIAGKTVLGDAFVVPGRLVSA